MITLDPTVTFSAGAIVGALAMRIIDHQLAKIRASEDRKIKEFNQAAAKFRSAIITELTGLYPRFIEWDGNTIDSLNASLPKIQSAVEEFRHFIAPGDIKSFNKAWNNYYDTCKHTNKNGFSYSNIISEIENSKNVINNFKHNIDTILAFAKDR